MKYIPKITTNIAEIAKLKLTPKKYNRLSLRLSSNKLTRAK